jgi:hypothetical protein
MTPVERVLAIAAAFLVIHSTSARAQSAEAEVLFRDGRILIKNGKLAEGCAKIEASERIESSVGTLLNLGDCREKLGKVASAWAAFRKAEATAKRANNDDKREDEARKRAIALEPKMSSLTIEVAQPAAGLVVKRDGEPLDAALLNTAVPLDPGTYTISAEAPGYTAWKTDVVLQFKTKRSLAIPALERSKVVAVPAAAPAPTVVYRKVHRTWSGWRKFSVVLGVAGVGAAGTGFYFGMRSRELEDSANERCPLVVCTDQQALRDNDRARDNATRANILYIAGGVAVASAVALWFVGGPGESTVVTPMISSDQAGVSVLGSF